MGFYCSYMLLLNPPILMHSWYVQNSIWYNRQKYSQELMSATKWFIISWYFSIPK